MPWWSTLKPYSRLNVILFQVDLAGHSAWIEKMPTDIETARARTDFAARLAVALESTGFDRLNWLGDGGLFVRRLDSHEDAESVCGAADEAFALFEDWRRPNWNLHLRASATFAETVFVHPDQAGYWCSPRLNAFLKFERDIAQLNTFVITDELYRLFRPNGHCAERFTDNLRINLGRAEQITIWIDNRFRLVVHEDPLRFLAWIQSRANETPFVRWRQPNKPDPAQALWFGDACVFSASLEAIGHHAIELTLAEFPGADAILRQEDRITFEASRSRYRDSNVTGTSLSLIRLRGELTDEPIVRIQYRLSAYEDIKAFEHLIETNPSARDYYLPLLLRVLQEGTSVPTTLSNHVVVIVGQPASGQHLIAAHRRKGRRVGSFSDNCWSVSFEEQFKPAKGGFASGDVEPDRTIADCALRGLREELVGDRYAGAAHIGVHAFAVEGSILNFAVLSLVELPDATVDDIYEWWSTLGVARDVEEHDALVGIPLEKRLLLECLDKDSLPEQVRSHMVGGSGLNATDHRWHPTAALRLAFTTWYAERQIAKPQEG